MSRCLGDIVRNISKKGVFAHFLREAWGEFYKNWLKSNKFQSFRLMLPIINLTVYFLSRSIEISRILQFYIHVQKSRPLQNGGMTLRWRGSHGSVVLDVKVEGVSRVSSAGCQGGGGLRSQ